MPKPTDPEKQKYMFTIVIEKDKDGYYAYCPQLQGCNAQGETYEEVLANIKDVLELHIADRKAEKESWLFNDEIDKSWKEYKNGEFVSREELVKKYGI